MIFNAKQFCLDHDIQWYPPGTKNVGPDFIGIQCPMCDDHSSHGGFNIKKSYYSCHRCGGHWMPKIIAILTKTDISNAKKIIKQYSTGQAQVPSKPQKKHKYVSKIQYPPGTGPLTEKAKQYLISRNFNPDKLVAEWGLLSTGHLGEYKFRILAPIYFQGELVSYQCRDITGKSKTPYRGCHIDESVIPLKYTLYGFDKAVVKKRCIVVEGITDAWRLGFGACATFGKNFTPKQMLLLVKHFDEIFILFDPDDAGQEQADVLYSQLIGFGKNAEILNLEHDDPGDLSDEDARIVMREVGL